jgi:eukaryotic-like serine/threonine-protein kinase
MTIGTDRNSGTNGLRCAIRYPATRIRTVRDVPVVAHFLLSAHAMSRTAGAAGGSNKRPLPTLPRHTDGSGDDDSTMLRTTVQSDGSDETFPANPVTCAPVDCTHTSDSLPAAMASSSRSVSVAPTATQFRDPDRYQILGEHGRGGLGRVSRAHDRELSRDVAIKELISRGHVGEVRFLREALITARLEHPGIVPVHEAGRWPDGTPFYAMKLVAGRPLRELIAERTTVEQRVSLLHHVIAVADAIAYAHGRNIIHRDLKPANVIVGDFGETIVIDWGLAKDLTAAEESTVGGGPFRINRDDELTSAGSVLGTPTYMAPEQERGEHVDQRADVFAIGAMLWELCALQKVPPTDRRQRHRILRRAGIDKDLATILDKALDPAPDRRYHDAGALAADLKAFKSGARISSRSYTLFAMLAHWTRRHRALAVVAATAFVLLSVTVAASVVNVSRDRANAVAAQETAIIATATALLDRDPTRAWSTLQSVATNSATTLLRARITAGGVADLSVELPARVDMLFTTPSGRWIVAATADRAIYVVSPENGSMNRISDGLTEPSAIAATDDLVYHVRRQDRLTLVSVPIGGGARQSLANLDQIPGSLVANDSGVYWSDSAGTVWSIQHNAMARIVARNASQFSVANTTVVICDRDGNLRITHEGAVEEVLGPCSTARSWTVAPVGFAIPRSSSEVTVYRHGEPRTIALETGVAYPNPRFSSNGLLVAIDARGSGAILRPGDSEFERIRLNGRTTVIGARDDYAAWGFRDGGVRVLDTQTGQEWSIQAHPEDVWWLAVLPQGRLVTSGRRTLRFWTLPRAAPKLVAQIAAAAFNIDFNEHGDAIVDGNDGHAYLVRTRERGGTTPIHKHDQITYGVSWCGSFACSTGWDSNVICTDTRRADLPTIATALGSSTIWIASGGGHCYAAAAAGGIYDPFEGAVALYKHSDEPYRLAVARDGRFIASGDWSGSVNVYDTVHRVVSATRAGLHKGLVTNIALTSANIVTSGADGFVRVLTPSLQDVKIWILGSAVRYLVASDTRIGAALEDGTLWITSRYGAAEHVFRTNTTFTSFAISPNGQSIAAGTIDGEVVVVNNHYGMAAIRLERGRVTCAAFNEDETITVCSPTGRILQIPISDLNFQH